jgi:hypothetical protein
MSTSRLFSVFVGLALVVVTVLMVRAGIATSETASSSNAALAVETARWAAIGESYTKLEAQHIQRGQEAQVARWQALGESYAKLNAQRIQRNQAAETARWAAMGEFYAPLEAQRIQRSQEAATARWQGLGESYAR